MKLSNIFRAWLSTLIGLFIPVIVGVSTQLATGQVDWNKVKISLIATGLLALTDLLSEVKKSLDGNNPVSVILLLIGLGACLSGCGLFHAAQQDCNITYSAPSSTDSTYYMCLHCKGKIVTDVVDSARVIVKPKK